MTVCASSIPGHRWIGTQILDQNYLVAHDVSIRTRGRNQRTAFDIRLLVPSPVENHMVGILLDLVPLYTHSNACYLVPTGARIHHCQTRDLGPD